MAGSYNHAISDDGQLLRNADFAKMVENLGDAYETAEEMYGMIWHLAADLERASGGTRKAAENVEWARTHYRQGLELSPGTRGTLPDEDGD